MTNNDSALGQIPSIEVNWDEDAVFFAFGHRGRRRVLAYLAQKGPQPGSALSDATRQKLDTTLHQLALLCKAGVVVKIRNQTDGRMPIYALNPAIRVTNSEHQSILDFKFATFHVSLE